MLQAVNLNLPSGGIWATYNVGAISPEQLGICYTWAKPETKNEYSEGSYAMFHDSPVHTDRYYDKYAQVNEF